jgi:hypothetical protein
MVYIIYGKQFDQNLLLRGPLKMKRNSRQFKDFFLKSYFRPL